MSATPAQRRFRQAIAAAAAAAVLFALGGLAVWRDAALGTRPDVSGPVLPGWSARAGEAARIEIGTSAESFALVRNGEYWVMPSRGGYRVRPERIAELDEALTRLQYEQAMTQDPDKFSRLGVGDPSMGGRGVQLTVLDASSRALAALTVGDERADTGTYLRLTGSERTFAAAGTMPDLSDPGRWLGLEFWDVDPGSVLRARIRPETGPEWRVQRPGVASRNFALTEPEDWTLITGGAANGVATAGARLRFRDVKPAAQVDGAFVARHAGTTASGLTYSFDFVAEDAQRWALIEVEASTADAAAQVQQLRALTEGWAFQVSDDAYERLTRPLNAVAEPASDPESGPVTGPQ